MEILLEAVLELFLYVYVDLIESFLDEISLKKWQRICLIILCFTLSVGSILLVLIGAFWVIDNQSLKTWGIIFLVVGGCILLIHILLGLFARVHHKVEIKRKEELWSLQSVREKESQPQIYEIKIDEEESKDL